MGSTPIELVSKILIETSHRALTDVEAEKTLSQTMGIVFCFLPKKKRKKKRKIKASGMRGT